MRPLRIAVIGCGSFGAQMARLMASLPGFEIAALCDPEAEKAERLAEDFGAPVYTRLAECLANRASDVAAIFTPNFLHCEQAVEAAAAGRHIFCEKPMAMNVDQCYRMMEAADTAGVKLMVGHKRRLRPQYACMADLVRSLRFGRIMAVNVTGFFHREAESWWRRRDMGGGLLPYAGVHDIDFLRHLCGEAASVYARTPVKMNHHTDYEDAISVLIHFETGPVASLQVSPYSPLYTFRQAFGVHIVLERGAIVYDPLSMTVRAQSSGGPPEVWTFDNDAGFTQAYVRELTSFADWIRSGSEPVLNAWDGLRCVEIMQAAQISAFSGREVTLPLPGRCATGSLTARARRYASGLSMPEGPSFGLDGALYVANCRADFVSRIAPDGQTGKAWTTGGKTQGVAIGRDGRVFISDHSKKTIFRGLTEPDVEVHCDRYRTGAPLRGPNEIAFGPSGHLYFTDPGNAWRGRATGAFSRVLEDRAAEVLAADLEFTNGFDFSPSGDAVYLAESTTGKILRAALNGDGTLAQPFEEFFHFEGRLGPDGVRVARSGNLYVTMFGHGLIGVVSPEGRLLEQLRVPGLFPTNCIFKQRALLVCEAQTGAIWEIETAEEGAPPWV